MPDSMPSQVSDEMADLSVSARPALTRAVVYIIGLFTASALTWMWLGEVDVVASSQFRLVPLGRARTLQAPRDGRVDRIDIREGDIVDAGHPAVKLKSRETVMDLRALEQTRSRLARARFRLEVALPREDALRLETLSDLKARREVTLALARAHRKAAADVALSQGTPGVETANPLETGAVEVQDEIRLRTAEIQHLQRRYANSRALHERGLISRTQLEEARVVYLSALADLPGRMAEVHRFQTLIRDLDRQILGVELEREQAERKAREEFQDARLAHDAARQVIDRDPEAESDAIQVPETAVITQLLLNSVGQIVSKGQVLATYAPTTSPLVAEAAILDRDVGTVAPGMVVRLKYEAFPYADYGIQTGTLSEVSPDTILDPVVGSAYRATILLNSEEITARGVTRRLRYGMKGTAEIVTGRQSVLDLILKPIRELRRSAEFPAGDNPA